MVSTAFSLLFGSLRRGLGENRHCAMLVHSHLSNNLFTAFTVQVSVSDPQLLQRSRMVDPQIYHGTYALSRRTVRMVRVFVCSASVLF